MYTLESGIIKKYSGLFLLTEDSLRRIQNSIIEAQKNLNFPTNLVFRIERNDDKFYETKDISEILSEPNIISKDVFLLEIFVNYEKLHKNENLIEYPKIVGITFVSDHVLGTATVYFKINFENKNWALQLADELDILILQTFRIKRIPFSLFLLLPILLLVPLVVKYKNVFADYSGTILIILAVLVFSYLQILGQRPNWYKQYVRIGPTFYIGEGKYRYESAIKFKNNFIWTIIIGFIVSFLASCYILIFT